MLTYFNSFGRAYFFMRDILQLKTVLFDNTLNKNLI